MEDLINLKEAANILNVSTTSVRNFAKQKKLSTCVIGKCSKYYRKEVLLLKENIVIITEREQYEDDFNEELIKYKLQCTKTVNDIKYQSDFYKFLFSNSDYLESCFMNLIKIIGYDILNERSLDIIDSIIFKGSSLREISDKHDITIQRVRQIFLRSLSILSNYKEYHSIKDMEEKIMKLTEENLNLKMKLEDKKPLDSSDIDMLDKLKMKILDINFNVRALNCLKGADINIIGELVKLKRCDLMKYRNFGRWTIASIEKELEKYNLYLGMDISKYEEFLKI